MKRLLFLGLLLCSSYVSAQEVKDSVQIYFHAGKSHLDASLRNNQRALDRIADSLQTGYSDSIFRLQKILVVGAASPEGSVTLNKQLSEKRAKTLFDYLSQYRILPDSLKTSHFIGRNWEGLLALAEKDPKLPYRQATLELLRSITREVKAGTTIYPEPLVSLQRLHGGKPYQYMYRHFFPELRYSSLHLWYKKIQNPKAPIQAPPPVIVLQEPDTVIVHTPKPDTTYVAPAIEKRPFYMAVKTNLLYDVLLIPNVGVEFYLGKDWSIAGNWQYAWWSNDRKHNYWRVYGGDLALRKWFGSKAKEKPLTGHHLGIYVQALTYDFERGGRGYMGGEPGGNIFERANYAAGVEYGYSHPIGRRLNLDFTLGVGYGWGKYYEYLPMDDCYVWQTTKNRRWFGPTKAEVSLVWLLGRGNENKKGGNR